MAKKVDTKTGGHKASEQQRKAEEEPLLFLREEVADLIPDFRLKSRTVSPDGSFLTMARNGLSGDYGLGPALRTAGDSAAPHARLCAVKRRKTHLRLDRGNPGVNNPAHPKPVAVEGCGTGLLVFLNNSKEKQT